jgi:DNA adenine methylase
MTSQTIKPFLKWVGGKSQILEDVLHLFPGEIKDYYEPFVGGGSVLLGFLTQLKNKKINLTGKVYASDINPNLIALYKNIKEKPEEVITQCKNIITEYSRCTGTTVNRNATTLEEALTSPESYYFWIRSQFNSLKKEERTTSKASAMLLFMNKTCFRGLYREGPKGFNVPFGNYKNPSILDEAHIRQVSELIQNVVFTCTSYKDALTSANEGDFVYLDPPYAPENEGSFVGYTVDGFTLENHKELFKLCNSIVDKKVGILMSNSAVPLVTNAFLPPKFVTKTIVCRRAINSKKPESKTNEVLISNGI